MNGRIDGVWHPAKALVTPTDSVDQVAALGKFLEFIPVPAKEAPGLLPLLLLRTSGIIMERARASVAFDDDGLRWPGTVAKVAAW